MRPSWRPGPHGASFPCAGSRPNLPPTSRGFPRWPLSADPAAGALATEVFEGNSVRACATPASAKADRDRSPANKAHRRKILRAMPDFENSQRLGRTGRTMPSVRCRVPSTAVRCVRFQGGLKCQRFATRAAVLREICAWWARTGRRDQMRRRGNPSGWEGRPFRKSAQIHTGHRSRAASFPA